MRRTHTEHVISQPGLTITHDRGMVGPAHDPYGRDEWTIERGTNKVVVVMDGLSGIHFGGWINKRRVSTLSFGEDKHKAFDPTVREYTGFTFSEWMKFIGRLEARRHSRCAKCGGQNIGDESGFPGESITMCRDCHHVISSSMNWSAIE